MKKRVFSLLLSSCVLSCLICGCGGDGGSIIVSGGKSDNTPAKELTVFGNRNDRYSLSVIEETLQGFMAENEVIVTYESATETSYLKALNKRFETDHLDDIFAVDRDSLLSLSKGGAVENITPAVNTAIYNDFVKSQLYMQGAIYSLPTAISTYGLFVNHDLLNEYGFTKAPTTLTKFSEICEEFKKEGITPVILNNYSSLRSLILAVGMYDIYCNGDTQSKLENFNAHPTELSSYLESGIDFVYGMIESDWIDIDAAAMTVHAKGEIELFLSGEYPFMITDSWVSDLMEERKEGQNLNYRIYPYPVFENDSVLVAGTDMISLKKGASVEAQKLFANLTKRSTLTTLNYFRSRLSPFTSGSEGFDASAKMIQSASKLSEGKFVISGDTRLSLPLDRILNECTALILNGASKDEVKASLSSLLGGEAHE